MFYTADGTAGRVDPAGARKKTVSPVARCRASAVPRLTCAQISSPPPPTASTRTSKPSRTTRVTVAAYRAGRRRCEHLDVVRPDQLAVQAR